MKTKHFFLFLLFTTQNTFAQIIFEKGYFTDNKNNKIECLIKNYDWKNNPRSIEYKLNENSALEKVSIEAIKEFCIGTTSKFIRANVNIDRSMDELDKLSTLRNPVWNEEQLFLEVLIEGKASLYYYEDGNLNRFFYSINDSLPQQLIYKRFIYKESMIGVNDGYRQQLSSNLPCSNIKEDYVKNIKYKKSELKNYFKKYNSTVDSTKKELSYTKNNKFNIHIKLALGLNTTALSAKNLNSHTNIHFDRNISFSLGLDGEIILPYNRNKWGIIFNPTYQYLNATMQYQVYNMLTGQSFPKSATINYNSIEFPIGIRHYIFLKKDIKIFLNALYLPAVTLSLTKNTVIEEDRLNIKTRDNYAIGGGIDSKKLSAELRYYASRSIVSDYVPWQTNYTRIALILGVRLF